MFQISKFQIRSTGLHILAMVLMLCDHSWAMLFPSAEWLTCVGRIAYPIFAFMIVEGFFHTHNLRRYLLRLLIWALVSEIPFDLMYASTPFFPYHQNVLWTFLLSLLIISLIERCRLRLKPVLTVLISAGLAAAGFLIGYMTMVDYYGIGVLTVLTFYAFRKRTWTNRLLQFLCLYVLNVKLLGGYYYEISVFGLTIEIVQQGLALFALIPIWLYQGKQGFHSKAFQYFCYAFYPAHMLLLFVVRELWPS
ncbi:MAG: conjugal transfer protein TraX [Lachnospiraceae bacterium]|nr:conjugal transfer protein TraX [Lachnospiraceae bacterium]